MNAEFGTIFNAYQRKFCEYLMCICRQFSTRFQYDLRFCYSV